MRIRNPELVLALLAFRCVPSLEKEPSRGKLDFLTLLEIRAVPGRNIKISTPTLPDEMYFHRMNITLEYFDT
jgi:hypothetical protein